MKTTLSTLRLLLPLGALASLFGTAALAQQYVQDPGIIHYDFTVPVTLTEWNGGTNANEAGALNASLMYGPTKCSLTSGNNAIMVGYDKSSATFYSSERSGFYGPFTVWNGSVTIYCKYKQTASAEDIRGLKRVSSGTENAIAILEQPQSASTQNRID